MWWIQWWIQSQVGTYKPTDRSLWLEYTWVLKENSFVGSCLCPFSPTSWARNGQLPPRLSRKISAFRPFRTFSRNCPGKFSDQSNIRNLLNLRQQWTHLFNLYVIYFFNQQMVIYFSLSKPEIYANNEDQKTDQSLKIKKSGKITRTWSFYLNSWNWWLAKRRSTRCPGTKHKFVNSLETKCCEKSKKKITKFRRNLFCKIICGKISWNFAENCFLSDLFLIQNCAENMFCRVNCCNIVRNR